MARRVSLSQFRSHLRQVANKQRQAIGAYNRAVRQVNQNRRQAVTKLNQAISEYNQAVRRHNANVRAHRSRRAQALSRLQSLPRSTRYEQFTSSVYSLHSAFVRLEQHYEQRQTPDRESLLDMSEQESANSLELMNVLLSEDAQTVEGAGSGSDSLQTSDLGAVLEELSPDLLDRWTGALIALNPKNPEATRHFCTSARETFVELLNLIAPDDEVLEAEPACDKTQQGSPTRRARIRFLLDRQGALEAEDFAVEDIENILQLLPVLSGGTHGPARRFGLPELAAVKRRVEDGIRFLLTIAGGPPSE